MFVKACHLSNNKIGHIEKEKVIKLVSVWSHPPTQIGLRIFKCESKYLNSIVCHLPEKVDLY